MPKFRSHGLAKIELVLYHDIMATFSSSPEDPIVRELDFGAHQQLRSAEQDLDDFYDLVDTANEILEKGYTRIALQFPDELLNDSVPIYKRLNSLIRTQQELYVLADTSYGRYADRKIS